MWEDNDRILNKRLKLFVLFIKGPLCLLYWIRTWMCWRVVVNRQVYNGSWESNLEMCSFLPNLFPLHIYIYIRSLILTKYIPQDLLLAYVKLNSVRRNTVLKVKAGKRENENEAISLFSHLLLVVLLVATAHAPCCTFWEDHSGCHFGWVILALRFQVILPLGVR